MSILSRSGEDSLQAGVLPSSEAVMELLEASTHVNSRIPLKLWAPDAAPPKRLPLMPWQDNPTVVEQDLTGPEARSEYGQFDPRWQFAGANITFYDTIDTVSYDATAAFEREKRVGVPSSTTTLQETVDARYAGTLEQEAYDAIEASVDTCPDKTEEEERSTTYGLTWTLHGTVREER